MKNVDQITPVSLFFQSPDPPGAPIQSLSANDTRQKQNPLSWRVSLCKGDTIWGQHYPYMRVEGNSAAENGPTPTLPCPLELEPHGFHGVREKGMDLPIAGPSVCGSRADDGVYCTFLGCKRIFISCEWMLVRFICGLLFSTYTS